MLPVHPAHCQPKHPPRVLEVLGQELLGVLLGQAGQLGVQVPLALIHLLKCKTNRNNNQNHVQKV